LLVTTFIAVSNVYLNQERSELTEWISTNVNLVKLKVKFNPEQAMKPRVGGEA
jgi:hypothetical protein